MLQLDQEGYLFGQSRRSIQIQDVSVSHSPEPHLYEGIQPSHLTLARRGG
jgi:hypothetical protein